MGQALRQSMQKLCVYRCKYRHKCLHNEIIGLQAEADGAVIKEVVGMQLLCNV